MLCLSPNKVLVLLSPLGPDFGKNPLLLSSSLLNVTSPSLRLSTNPETHPFLHGAVLWIDFENGSKFCSTVSGICYVFSMCWLLLWSLKTKG